MRSLIPGVIAPLLTAPAALAAGIAAQEKPREISIGVDVFAGGMHVLTIDSRTRLDTDGYNLETQLNSRGFVGWVSGFSQHTMSEGRITDGQLQPTAHLNSGIWRGDSRRIEMRYGPRGPVEVMVDPVEDPSEREPVPASLQRDTVDPLSAILFVNQPAFADAEACAWTVPVFDGRRRYNLRFERIAEETLPASRHGVYSGAAVKCRVHYDSIAGRYTGTRWRTSSEPTPPSHVWFARPEGTDLWVPVRFEAEHSLGWVLAYLTRLDVTP
jgi:hypothetical protein